jgi:flagellar protein FlbD
MIRLTRLNNQPLAVNSDLIKFVEQAPDTVLTLLTGEKIVVLETAQQVLDKIIDFRRSIARASAAIDVAPEGRDDDETGQAS